MTELHTLIYQLSLKPKMVIELIQNRQYFMNKFNLSQNEMTALETSLASTVSIQSLLCPEKLHTASIGPSKPVEKPWVP